MLTWVNSAQNVNRGERKRNLQASTIVVSILFKDPYDNIEYSKKNLVAYFENLTEFDYNIAW
jgi:hypothetical protein